jgi:hypothetical protein
MEQYCNQLPELSGETMVADIGLDTNLIFSS